MAPGWSCSSPTAHPVLFVFRRRRVRRRLREWTQQILPRCTSCASPPTSANRVITHRCPSTAPSLGRFLPRHERRSLLAAWLGQRGDDLSTRATPDCPSAAGSTGVAPRQPVVSFGTTGPTRRPAGLTAMDRAGRDDRVGSHEVRGAGAQGVRYECGRTGLVGGVPLLEVGSLGDRAGRRAAGRVRVSARTDRCRRCRTVGGRPSCAAGRGGCPACTRPARADVGR